MFFKKSSSDRKINVNFLSITRMIIFRIGEYTNSLKKLSFVESFFVVKLVISKRGTNHFK
jgi:hypothetical protein